VFADLGTPSDVIDKVSGEVVSKYTTEPFFAFHEVSFPPMDLSIYYNYSSSSPQSNSFEDSETGSIVIDLPILTNYTFLNAARLPNLRAMVGLPNASATHDIPGIFRRYRLPDFTKTNRTANGTIVSRPAVLDFEIEYKTGNIELPRINQAYNNKPYRYS
jgi:torulene dioxygenase